MRKVILFIAFILLNTYHGICSNPDCSTISIDNGKLKLSFEQSTGRLVSFQNVKTSYEYINPAIVESVPWKINTAQSQPSIHSLPTRVRIAKVNPLAVEIKWEQTDNTTGPEVIVYISLDKEKALSYWSIKINKIGDCHIENIQFPILYGIKDLGKEDLAVSSWLGNLIHNPRQNLKKGMPSRTFTWNQPGELSMQLIALYNSQKKSDGLYLACNDTLSYTKDFSMTFDTEYSKYNITNILPYNNQIDTYSPSYQAIIGSFDGDWISAAKMYREWGIRQKWCRESRFKNGKIADWLPKTAVWIWNRGRSSNVLSEAIDLKQRLGLPVNAYWHWWHNCSYDDGFPEYIPPREGRESFIKAVSDAHDKGVHCIVYMNSFQWGNSTNSWTKENAEPYSVKTIDGGNYSHIYNIFTNKPLTPMCMATEFWQNKYSTLCDTVINNYHTNGVYMDQACLNYRCYDSSHGHEIGGGNYWVDGFKNLTSLIRSKISNQTEPILAGEGSGEDWMAHLDLFMTLDPSRERYAGVGNSEPIPLFQAVYHDYAITYGSYSSLVYPPYDELWPAKYSPANQETILPDHFNSQYLMEQARAFVWGMQPTIANYHSFLTKNKKAEIDFLIGLAKTRNRALKYLLYGVYYRCPEIHSHKIAIDISKISIYAGREGNTVTNYRTTVPTIYSSAWKSSDGCLGIALANINNKLNTVSFTLSTSEYNLHKTGDIYVITDKGRTFLKKYKDETVIINLPIAARSTCVIEFIPTRKQTILN